VRVSEIYTYPVKGCRRVRHDAAAVEPWGLAGDRRWLITEPGGVAITQRDLAKLALLRAHTWAQGVTLSFPGRASLVVGPLTPDPTVKGTVWGTTVAATPAGDRPDAWLSAVLGTKVRLIWLDDPTRRTVDPDYGRPDDRVSFADGYPILLTNTASLDQLNDWMGEPLPMTRFRPNVVMDSDLPFVEDEWTGGTVRIGQMMFRVPKPCDRCVVTNTDQETGVRGKEPLRTLAKYRNIDRGLMFGTNLIPVRTGTIRVGDAIT
jgi:MOSC domain-containing protein